MSDIHRTFMCSQIKNEKNYLRTRQPSLEVAPTAVATSLAGSAHS